MLTSELVTDKNLEEAVKLQNQIFPRENARENFIASINDKKPSIPSKFQLEYFLVRDENRKAVGIWGHYLQRSKKELWLGWFGVAPDEVKKGYGKEIFSFFENYAKENDFTTIRLYTDEVDNRAACKFYEKNGMTKEYYENKNDQTFDIGRILIYSKSLTNKKVVPWNSKFINYKAQKERESKKNRN